MRYHLIGDFRRAHANRELQRLRQNAKDLKLRPDDFDSVLRSMGFGPAQHLGVIGAGGN
jgi:7SK snRNA methylphosphate capping enzyme